MRRLAAVLCGLAMAVALACVPQDGQGARPAGVGEPVAAAIGGAL